MLLARLQLSNRSIKKTGIEGLEDVRMRNGTEHVYFERAA